MPDTPTRIQLRRAKGWKMPSNTVKVDRSTKWGNPYRVGMWKDFSAQHAVGLFRRWVEGEPSLMSAGWPPSKDAIQRHLRGKNLACWCAPGEPCHADVLLEIANG